MNLDEEGRLREADFCRYEIEELEQAGLKEGEEEEFICPISSPAIFSEDYGKSV